MATENKANPRIVAGFGVEFHGAVMDVPERNDTGHDWSWDPGNELGSLPHPMSGARLELP
jgi:hypothetical protein